MKRKTLILANPGERSKGYLEGVNKDVLNYQSFLRSPIGGLWSQEEIEVLIRPQWAQVQVAARALKQVDYAPIVFTGHGYHSREYDSTILELTDGQEIDSVELSCVFRRTLPLIPAGSLPPVPE